jgi:hypothetical protein
MTRVDDTVAGQGALATSSRHVEDTTASHVRNVAVDNVQLSNGLPCPSEYDPFKDLDSTVFAADNNGYNGTAFNQVVYDAPASNGPRRNGHPAQPLQPPTNHGYGMQPNITGYAPQPNMSGYAAQPNNHGYSTQASSISGQTTTRPVDNQYILQPNTTGRHVIPRTNNNHLPQQSLPVNNQATGSVGSSGVMLPPQHNYSYSGSFYDFYPQAQANQVPLQPGQQGLVQTGLDFSGSNTNPQGWYDPSHAPPR